MTAAVAVVRRREEGVDMMSRLGIACFIVQEAQEKQVKERRSPRGGERWVERLEKQD